MRRCWQTERMMLSPPFQVSPSAARESIRKLPLAKTTQGAAIVQHVRALNAGIMEVLTWARHDKDLEQWQPVTKAGTRLQGLELTTCTAKMRMAVGMTRADVHTLKT